MLPTGMAKLFTLCGTKEGIVRKLTRGEHDHLNKKKVNAMSKYNAERCSTCFHTWIDAGTTNNAAMATKLMV